MIVALLPTGTLVATNVTIVGGDTFAHQAVDDPYGSPDYATTCLRGTVAGVSEVRVSLPAFTPAALAINSITVVRISEEITGSGNPTTHKSFIVIGGTRYDGSADALGYLTWIQNNYTWVVNPATGVAWTKNDLNPSGGAGGFVIGYEENNTLDQGQCTQLILLVDYRPVPSGQNAVRNIASQILRRRRAPIRAPKMTVPCNELLDLELGDDASFVHEALGAPGDALATVGLAKWKRHLVNLRRRKIDPNTKLVEYVLWDQRGYLATFWFGAASLDSSSIAGQGVVLLGTGGAVVYLRNSPAWYEDLKSGLIFQYAVDEMPYPKDGVAFEGAASNLLAPSSFVNQLVSLTIFTGTNGASVVAEGSPPSPLFHSNVSGYAGKFTYGSNVTSGVNGVVYPDTASFPAGSRVSLTVDHLDSHNGAGDNLYVLLRRLVDNYTWDEATRSWVNGSINNPLPMRVTARTRDGFRDVNIGTNASVLRVAVWQRDGGTTVSRINRVYHTELANFPAPSSRVVNPSTVAGIRQPVTLTVAHTASKPALRNAGFSFHARYRPLYNRSEVNSLLTTVPLWYIQFSTGHRWKLSYHPGNQRFEFEALVGANLYSAYSQTLSVVAGQRYAISVRAATVDGEYGLAAYTLSIWVDGVRGTDATRSGNPTEASGSLHLGGDGLGTSQASSAWGVLEPILFTPEVLSDDEMARMAYL